MIKINLVREGRAVRGAAGGAAAAPAAIAGPSGMNNVLAVGLAILGAAIAIGYWFMTSRSYAKTEDTVTQRKVESQKLEAVIKSVDEYQKKKDDLQKRIDLINQLKQNQKGPVRVMDQISRDLPDLVWLDTLGILAGKISLTGRALNPNAIALFVTNIKNDPYFEEPAVGSVTAATVTTASGPTAVYSFDMNFAFSYTPKVPGAAGAPGAATDTSGTAAPTATSDTTSTTTTSGTAPVAGKPGKK